MTIPTGAPSYANQSPTAANLTTNPIANLDTGHFSVGGVGNTPTAGLTTPLIIAGGVLIGAIVLLKRK